jgi:O-antigen/teichoic acid export membrane protein
MTQDTTRTDPAASPAEVSMGSAVARSGMWTIIGQVAGLLTALIATPFTLRLLGPARYGLWSVLQTTIVWVGLADFGMGAASTRFAGEALARRDARAESTATWTATIISVTATAVVAGLAALFAPWVVGSILHVHSALRGTAATALRIVAGGAVFAAGTANLSTPLSVRLRWRMYSAVTQGGAILQVAAIPILLAVVGGGVITSASVATVVGGGALVCLVIIAVRLQPTMRRPQFSRRMARRLLVYGGTLTVAGLADIPLTTAERILLAHYRSTVAVAYYAAAMNLATLASMVPAAASQPLFPAVIRLQSSGEGDAARDLYGQILKGAFLILTPLLLLVALVAQPFLSLWAGHAYGTHSTIPCFVLLGGVWFLSLSWLPLTYLMATDRGGAIARIRLLEIPPFIVGAALLTAHLGALGAAIAWSARVAVDSVAFFAIGRRSAGLTISPLSQRVARAVALPALLAGAVVALALTTHGLPIRAGCGLLLMLCYAATAWRVVLAHPERAALRRLAASVNPLSRAAAVEP